MSDTVSEAQVAIFNSRAAAEEPKCAAIPRVQVFLDVSRLCTRIFRSAPTGIDRVEFAYANASARVEGMEVSSVMTAPFATGTIRRERIDQILTQLARIWGLDRTPADDAVYQRLKAHLEAPVDPDRSAGLRLRGPSTVDLIRREIIFPLRDFVRLGVRLRRQIGRAADRPMVYLHVSHTQLNQPRRFAWLRRFNVPAVFFVHDVIPIDYPEYCSPGSRERHLDRIKHVSELATLVVVNSHYTAQVLEAHLRQRNWRTPPIRVVPLGVDGWFLDRKRLEPPAKGPPYALCVSTIEPRKNHAFLLALWRRLIERMGVGAPRLVLVGRRGWENENVIDLLERSRTLAPHVVEVTDLSDAGLASLMAGAQVLLAPSFVEGFGLPLAESLALGVPVIASDIAAHREVGQGCATLLDPLDGAGWLQAICNHFDPQSDARAAALSRAARYRPVTWSEHVEHSLELVMAAARAHF